MIQVILEIVNILRIGNLRNSLFVKCVCKVKFIKSKQTSEGEFLPLDQKVSTKFQHNYLFLKLKIYQNSTSNFQDMDVGSATGADKLFLVTPMVLKHEITDKVRICI